MLTKRQLKKHVKAKRTVRQISQLENTSYTNVRYWLAKHKLKTVGKQVGLQVKPHNCACGETNPIQFYGQQKELCKACHGHRAINLQRKKKQDARDWLGAKCVNCGFDKYQVSLDIHHLDPKAKDPNFNTSRAWSWPRMVKELASCVLLCRNCHAAFHAGLLSKDSTSKWSPFYSRFV